MKLLVSRLLKVHSTKSILESGAVSLLQNYNTKYSSICLNRVPQKITTRRFQYQYEFNELVEKLKTLSNYDKLSPGRDVRTENLLDFLKTQSIETKEDVQAIVTILIIAAKLGQNVGSHALDESALKKFLELSDACIEQMTADDVVSALIALNILNIPLHHPVNRKLMIRVTNMLKGKC